MTRPRPMLRLRQLRPSTWRGVVTRSGVGFIKDNCLDLAAALTYWSLLGLFPAVIVVVSMVGLVATDQAALNTVLSVIDRLAPGEAGGFLEQRLREVVERRTTASVLLSIGLLGALWTASAYLRSFTRAANHIYQVPEGRPIYLLLPQQLGLTVLALIAVAAVVTGLVISGPVARAVGAALGVEAGTVRVWEVAKWPILALIALFLLSLMFWAAPNVQQPRLRWLAVGGAVALLVWAGVSVGFGIYVANFDTYNATYGALGAVVIFLVWVFLSNCAVLLGVEVNAELQRGRQLQGEPALDLEQPPLPPRQAS